jgi:serine/threonine protein kinase
MEAPEFRAPPSWTRKTKSNLDRPMLNFPSEVSFCEMIHSPDTEIEVVKRIGSESTEGEVYQIMYKGKRAALKLLPINSDEDIVKNESEIKIANMASNMVMEDTCEHFPLVYGSGQCNDVYFFQKRWREKGENYACIRKLRSQLPGAKSKQISALYRQGLKPVEIAEKFNLNMKVCDKLHVASNFLISELADEDLSSWAERRHSVDAWKDVIYQVLYAISCMQENMKICHRDLHWGNILLEDNENVLALIHDFGKSEPLVRENEKDDIVKFLSSWTGISYQLPNQIREWFQESEEIISHGGDIEDL